MLSLSENRAFSLAHRAARRPLSPRFFPVSKNRQIPRLSLPPALLDPINTVRDHGSSIERECLNKAAGSGAEGCSNALEHQRACHYILVYKQFKLNNLQSSNWNQDFEFLDVRELSALTRITSASLTTWPAE